jgi:hypothetical protein
LKLRRISINPISIDNCAAECKESVQREDMMGGQASGSTLLIDDTAMLFDETAILFDETAILFDVTSIRICSETMRIAEGAMLFGKGAMRSRSERGCSLGGVP